MQVKDLMTESIVSVSPEETAQTAAQRMAQRDLGALPVCGSDGGLRGIITDRDLLKGCLAKKEDPSKTKVCQLMTRNCATVSPAADVRQAARTMAQRQVRRLPVMEGDKLVGMVTLGDLARAGRCDMEAANALAEICQEDKTQPFA